MAIKYYIDLGCVPREQLGPNRLLNLYRRWQRAENLHQQFQEKYGVSDPKKMRLREKVAGGDSEDEVREVTVAEIKKECDVLEEYAHHCEGCPANATGAPYGCIHELNFPITQAAQNWLLGNLPREGSRTLELFVDSVTRHGYGKDPRLERWRNAGLIEGRPGERQLSDGFVISSDQVLSELFLVGDLSPGHLLGILLHLQALRTEDGRREDDLLDLFESIQQSGSLADAPPILFILEPSEGDDHSILQLKMFLECAFRAFSLQVPIVIET